jgi:hypothetical protein
MEARVDALEREMKSVKLTLSEMLMKQQKFHERCVALLTKATKKSDDGERKTEALENRSVISHILNYLINLSRELSNSFKLISGD